jgi:drug/metabolite transporter (DMT)-like permease
MPPLAIWVAVAIGGNVLYHVSQKSIPSGAPPLLSLLVTYAVAFVATALLLPLAPEKVQLREGIARLNWASVGVGVAIVAVELGVLLAYRAGWRMSVASITVNSALALVLVPVGIIVYRERLSAGNVAGLVLCLAGLILVARE